MLDRWKLAVVHLECAAHTEDVEERTARLRRLHDGVLAGDEVSVDEWAKGARDRRSAGTALFVVKDKRRYLVTARHVLWDEDAANRDVEDEQESAQNLPEWMKVGLIESAQERALNRTFNIIFRVPSSRVKWIGSFAQTAQSVRSLRMEATEQLMLVGVWRGKQRTARLGVGPALDDPAVDITRKTRVQIMRK